MEAHTCFQGYSLQNPVLARGVLGAGQNADGDWRCLFGAAVFVRVLVRVLVRVFVILLVRALVA